MTCYPKALGTTYETPNFTIRSGTVITLLLSSDTRSESINNVSIGLPVSSMFCPSSALALSFVLIYNCKHYRFRRSISSFILDGLTQTLTTPHSIRKGHTSGSQGTAAFLTRSRPVTISCWYALRELPSLGCLRGVESVHTLAKPKTLPFLASRPLAQASL